MQLTGGLPQHFANRMGALLGPDFPAEIGVAVSGGGDSMVLLHLAAGWARVMGIRLRPVTIDHGLRPESADEAALVAQECAVLGLGHDVLRWDGWDGRGNLMAAARQARLDLIGQWRGECRHVLFAHTEDDQAETLLLRLARGSGVEGLAAMSHVREVGGWWQVRPLLDVSRADLRHHAATLRIPFVEDPTNDDPAFARTRMRHLIRQEGLMAGTLAATAARMGRAAEALRRRAAAVAVDLWRPDPLSPGAIALDRDGFAAIEIETCLRILAGGLCWVSGDPLKPRLDPLEETLDRVLSGGTSTLHGGVVLARGDRIWIAREAAAQSRAPAAVGTIWDGRWRIDDLPSGTLEIGPLGEAGWAQLSERPDPRPPQKVLLSLPALWDGVRLVACPALGAGQVAAITLQPPGVNFPESLCGN